MKHQPSRKIIRNASLIALSYLRQLVGSPIGKRVICVHDIKDPHKFRTMLLWLKDHYEMVSLEELFQRQPERKNMVAVTFDDGYTSWHGIVAPLLEELNIPATFFVCSGFVGLEGEKARQFVRTYLHRQQELYPLNRVQLSDLAHHPLFEIGSHTVHHIDLGQCRNQETLECEINGDCKQLQDWTGENIRWFAYPFGVKQTISKEALNFLEHASFLAAFTLIPKFLTEKTNRFLVGRDGLDVEDSVRIWSAWLQGNYDFLYTLKSNFLEGMTILRGR